MSNPRRYFVEERKYETIAVKGQGKQRAARVVESDSKADKLAHHFAGSDGVVEFKDIHGKFEKCLCSKCKGNR